MVETGQIPKEYPAFCGGICNRSSVFYDGQNSCELCDDVKTCEMYDELSDDVWQLVYGQFLSFRRIS